MFTKAEKERKALLRLPGLPGRGSDHQESPLKPGKQTSQSIIESPLAHALREDPLEATGYGSMEIV